MSRPGRSTQPCHGCGSTLPHLTGRVCDTCAQALVEHSQIMAQRAAMKDAVVMASKEREYALPRLEHTPDLRDERGSPHYPIQEGFLELTRALSTSCQYTSSAPLIFKPAPNEYAPNNWRTYVRINPDHAKVLGDTYEAVRVALEHAYRKGHADGRNLLGQLASGQITEDEFNDCAIRKEGCAL